MSSQSNRVASQDVLVTRYGGNDYAPEGGEALFIADKEKFEKNGPASGVEILDRYENDNLSVRIRLGKLEDQEENEWITRHSVQLENPSGVLTLGSWFPDFYCADAPYVHQPWSTEIKGHHTLKAVVVYTYLPFLIARGGLIEAMSMPETHEHIRPWGRWFRETRPDEKMPDWLVDQCREWPGIDPGYEKEWETQTESPARPSENTVEVLINLLSIDDPIPIDEKRELKIFPMGIQGKTDCAK